MDSEGIRDRNSSSILNCASSVMATTSLPYNVEGLPICSGPLHSAAWDSIIPDNQTGRFGNIVLQNEFAGPSHLAHFPSDSCLADVVQKIPCFGRSFEHMDSQEKHHQNSGDQLVGTLHNGKRKRKNVQEKQKDPTGNTAEILKVDDEKKSISSNSRGRQAGKQAKDDSIGGETCKENYIHVRAKRGQATNSHSLAERVRRERISERMKMLQELVPGCNKITGKAVMLDEIINYVQSLQQQVEFLSMKLATVNPELNVDAQRALSKDIIRSRVHSNLTALQGLSSSHHPLVELPQGFMDGFPGSTVSQFQTHPLPQNLWNSPELQSLIQMGFENLEPHGD